MNLFPKGLGQHTKDRTSALFTQILLQFVFGPFDKYKLIIKLFQNDFFENYPQDL